MHSRCPAFGEATRRSLPCFIVHIARVLSAGTNGSISRTLHGLVEPDGDSREDKSDHDVDRYLVAHDGLTFVQELRFFRLVGLGRSQALSWPLLMLMAFGLWIRCTSH